MALLPGSLIFYPHRFFTSFLPKYQSKILTIYMTLPKQRKAILEPIFKLFYIMHTWQRYTAISSQKKQDFTIKRAAAFLTGASIFLVSLR